MSTQSIKPQPQPAVIFIPEDETWDADKNDTIVVRDQKMYQKLLKAAEQAVDTNRKGVSIHKVQPLWMP